MARVFIEGFELNNLKNWTIADITTCSSGATVYNLSGQYYCRLTATKGLIKDVTATSEYYASCRFQNSTTVQPRASLIVFYNGTVALGYVKAEIGAASNHIWATFGGASWEGSINLDANETYRVEARYKPSTSNDGNFQVKVNGILDISKTSTVTATATTTINRIGFFGLGGYTYIDDIVIENAEWPGNTRIQGVFMDGAGSATGWTPSVGSNYDCVEEISSSTAVIVADYVYASSISITDYYSGSTLVAGTNPITEVKAVQLTAMAKIDGVCTATKLKLKMLTTAGTTHISSTFALQEDVYTNINYILSDTAAITPTIANGLEFGFISTN